MVAIVVFSWLALRNSWTEVGEAMKQLTVFDIVAAAVALVVSTWGMYRAWRVILEGLHATELRGSDARTMFYCAQLGKYVPGSVWPALIQTEIGKRSHLPRPTVLTSYLFSMIASVGVGGCLSVLVLTHGTTTWVVIVAIGATVAGAAACIGFSHPSGSGRAVRWIAQRRASAADMRELDVRTSVKVLAWTLFGWVAMGLHATLLARPFGGSLRDGLFVLGSFALAWLCGFIALPLPAGAGIREAVLVVTLGRLIGHPAAISVALVSRMLMIVNDLVLSTVAGLPRIVREIRERGDVALVEE